MGKLALGDRIHSDKYGHGVVVALGEGYYQVRLDCNARDVWLPFSQVKFEPDPQEIAERAKAQRYDSGIYLDGDDGT